MTNKEKLSQMSSVELAEFFDIQGTCGMCANNSSCCLEKSCVQGLIKWLDSEVENG